MRGRNRFARNALAAAGFLTILYISGCSASPTPSVDAQPSAFATPAPQAAANSARLATSTTSDWTRVSSLSDKSDNSDVKTLYDASAFQSFDFWLGLSATPINLQQVFVRAPDAARVKSDPNAWTERFVLQQMTFPGENSFSQRAFDLWSIEDVDSKICHTGLTRKLLNVNRSEMVYESRFSSCPKKFPFLSDRVVLTRELMGAKSWRAGKQQIYILSYEVSGPEMTAAQRAEGIKLISAPELAGATLGTVSGPSALTGMP